MTKESMRRKDRQIDDRDEIDAIINDCDVCRLALAVDDAPYLVPLSFGYDGEALYLHTAKKGKKIEYFEANNRVCFEFERNVTFIRDDSGPCESTFSFESVIGYGTICEIVQTEEKSYALGEITRQYEEAQSNFGSDSMKRARVWKISIESMTGKRSPAPNAS